MRGLFAHWRAEASRTRFPRYLAPALLWGLGALLFFACAPPVRMDGPRWAGNEAARLALRACIIDRGINGCCPEWHAFVDAIYEPHELGLCGHRKG